MMNRLMMTVAAAALAAPALAQDAATTAPTATDQQNQQMTQTAPAEGTMAQDPAAPQATTGAAQTEGTMTTEPGMTTGTQADGMATGGTAMPQTATPGTGGTATTGTGGAAPMGAEGTAGTTGGAATTGATDGAAVTTQPMATEGGMQQQGMQQQGMQQQQRAELSAQNPGITASWLMDRAIYTTNQPSTTQWNETTGDTVPGDWSEIANVSDLVMTAEGEVVGYVADIGGFLGLGAHTVLLDRDMLHVSRFGDDVVLATNYTQEELEALPEFDTNNVMQ